MAKIIEFEPRNPNCWLIFQTRDNRQDQQPTLFAIAEDADEAFELVLEMAKVTRKERETHGLAYPMDIQELCQFLGFLRGQTFEAITYELYAKRADALPAILARLSAGARQKEALTNLSNDNTVGGERPAPQRVQMTISDATLKVFMQMAMEHPPKDHRDKLMDNALKAAFQDPATRESLSKIVKEALRLQRQHQLRERDALLLNIKSIHYA